MRNKKPSSGLKLVLPFFLVLAVLTVVSFIIPLRPTQSQMEKRNLAEFPEFSWEAIISGSYFDDISTWYSDTFPGRESWLTLSSDIQSLHGYSEIAIAEDTVLMEAPPEPEPEPVTDPEPVEEDTDSDETSPEEVTTAPTEEQWGGVDAGEGAEIQLGKVIQIGDSAFNFVGFSPGYSEKYADTISRFADYAAELGVRTVSAPAPTSVGIMIEPEYLEKLNCADQQTTIAYFHDRMSENVVKVDTFNALLEHNDEYIYFRTDHHWTALGAYYSYEAICKALGYEPVPLEDFEEWDQGEFEGSIYWKSPNPRKLRLDNVMAYIPDGDIECLTTTGKSGGSPTPLLVDTRERALNTKYLVFLGTDYALTTVTNNSIPDGPTCIVIKDSFGNPLVPFLAATYHKVYAIDYRKFTGPTLRWLIQVYEADDVIFAPYVTATQAQDGNSFFKTRAG